MRPLGYILHEIDFLLAESDALSRDAFLKDPLRQRALARSLEIIGEAVKRLPRDFRQRHPDVEPAPWSYSGDSMYLAGRKQGPYSQRISGVYLQRKGGTVNEASNKKAVEAIFDAFNRGAVDEVLAQLTDDAMFVSHLDPVVPWSGRYQGKGQVLQYFEALGGSVEIGDHPVEQVIAQGDVVVAQGSVSFTVRETGKPGSSTWVYVFKFADDKVRSFEQYNDQGLAEAFREQ